MSELVSFHGGGHAVKMDDHIGEDRNGDDNDYSSVLDSEHGDSTFPCTRANAGYTSLMVYQESVIIVRHWEVFSCEV